MTKANYHTHTYLCNHAEGLPIDYIKKAVDLNMKEIGISDHGFLNPAWVMRMNEDSYYNIYLNNIDKAIKKYHNKISIKKGLELEYNEKYDLLYQKYKSELDYMILGQHIIELENKNIDLYHVLSDEDIIAYKDMVLKGLKTKYFKILAHPDLFMLKYKKWNDLTIEISKAIIECAIDNDIFLEINANGARRATFYNDQYEETWYYPRLEFWRIVANYHDAKVIIGDDAHKIEHLHDSKNDELIKFAQNLGIKLNDIIF